MKKSTELLSSMLAIGFAAWFYAMARKAQAQRDK